MHAYLLLSGSPSNINAVYEWKFDCVGPSFRNFVDVSLSSQRRIYLESVVHLYTNKRGLSLQHRNLKIPPLAVDWSCCLLGGPFRQHHLHGSKINLSSERSRHPNTFLVWWPINRFLGRPAKHHWLCCFHGCAKLHHDLYFIKMLEQVPWRCRDLDRRVLAFNGSFSVCFTALHNFRWLQQKPRMGRLVLDKVWALDPCCPYTYRLLGDPSTCNNPHFY